MEIMITFSPGEAALLRATFAEKREALRTKWEVDSFEEYIELLAMHGLDHGHELTT